MVVYAAGNIVHDESVYPKNKNKNYRAFDKSLMSFFSISFKKYEDIRYDVYGEFIGNLLRFC